MAKKKIKFTPTDPFQKLVLGRFDSVDKRLEAIDKKIKFTRTDNAEMEDHLNRKIRESEERLSQKIEQVGARLEEKIYLVGQKVSDLESIHPNGKHVFAVN